LSSVDFGTTETIPLIVEPKVLINAIEP
jgi:hypothetical protein